MITDVVKAQLQRLPCIFESHFKVHELRTLIVPHREFIRLSNFFFFKKKKIVVEITSTIYMPWADRLTACATIEPGEKKKMNPQFSSQLSLGFNLKRPLSLVHSVHITYISIVIMGRARSKVVPAREISSVY